MKTREKQYQKAGNIAMVQVGTLEGEGLGFLTAASAMESGILEIRELRQEGTVNTLLAVNHSAHHYLLTDMDLLKGAKQNRVVNTSVLIAPHSKQEVHVSCVERSRWSYNSPTFKPGPEILDARMRAAKADSLKRDKKERVEETQSMIWGMINQEMVSNNFISETEDYASILEARSAREESMHKFLPADNCNGLAVFEGRRLVSFDIFGNRKAYRYYFELLAGNSLSRMQKDDGKGFLKEGETLKGKEALKEAEAMEQAEAFYRLDEYLDQFESGLESPVDPEEGNAGTLRWSGLHPYPGFELSLDGHLVHLAGFSRG
jgi:hypothetical protein